MTHIGKSRMQCIMQLRWKMEQKNIFQEASWLARTGEIRTCVLMSMFAGCCAPRDRCSPDPIWRTSSTPLDQLELPRDATVWPLMWTVEQRLGFFQTNIVPKWEYFCVVTDMITTISHIQFCLDRWKQECPASTITARSFSVTEQCLQCASRLWKLTSKGASGYSPGLFESGRVSMLSFPSLRRCDAIEIT